MAISNESLFAEIEDVLRSMPDKAQLRNKTHENQAWIGRAVSIIALSNPSLAAQARIFQSRFDSVMNLESSQGLNALLGLLYEGHATLRMLTFGTTNTAISRGLVFDYFDEIRKQIELAATDVFFIDPYLDADFVSRYLPYVRAQISIRLLGREKISTLTPAATQFAQQSGNKIELRTASNFHDRYLIVDHKACFQSGASFKDGGRTAPTTITQISDAFIVVKKHMRICGRQQKSFFSSIVI
jgi:hypothetical protein